LIRLPLEATPEELQTVLNGAVERASARGWTLAEAAKGVIRTLQCPHGEQVWLEADGDDLGAALSARLLDSVGCSCSSEFATDIRGTPFTGTEMNTIRQRMPLTASAPDWLAPGSKRPLEGLGAVFTIHHQRDFLVMLESAVALGLDPRHILVIDKEYEYLYRHRVDGHIRRVLGARTASYSQLEPTLEEFFKELRARWQRALLIDDGGYLLPQIAEGSPVNRQFVAGVVEQTSSGIVALEPYLPRLEIPIFDVAESDLKETVEARGVAAAGWRSLQNVLPDVHWNGRRALVCGYGRIGRALAHELARESVQVGIYDIHYARLVSALEDGFATHDSVGDAVRQWQPDLIFGATGRARWGANLFEALQRDCVMVSLTSRDYEFDKAFLEQRATEIRSIADVGTRYVIPTETGPRAALLVADGFPINFYRAESMPNEQSDLILAAMLLGSVAIVARRAEFSPGLNREKSNQIINEHAILTRYYLARKEQLRF